MLFDEGICHAHGVGILEYVVDFAVEAYLRGDADTGDEQDDGCRHDESAIFHRKVRHAFHKSIE